LFGVGTAWSTASRSEKWIWELAPNISNYKPDPQDTSFYYPLPQVVEMTSPFGWRTHPIHGDRRLHAGMDLGAPEGMPVLSAHSGYVRYADWGDGYGNMVIVEYADGKYQTLYAHLSEILVKQGEAIRPRQVIGRVGSTGGVTGPHLHFELLQKVDSDFQAIDPASPVKATEAYVAVKPPVSGSDPASTNSGSTNSAPILAQKPIANASGSNPSESQPNGKPQPKPLWQAPALEDHSQQANDTSRPPIADIGQLPPSQTAISGDAIAPAPAQPPNTSNDAPLSFELRFQDKESERVGG
jgi:murein DD-endopeptidase MepM/ murein hydrolase activator NlpD